MSISTNVKVGPHVKTFFGHTHIRWQLWKSNDLLPKKSRKYNNSNQCVDFHCFANQRKFHWIAATEWVCCVCFVSMANQNNNEKKLKAIYFCAANVILQLSVQQCDSNKFISTITFANLLGKYNFNDFSLYPIIIVIDKHFSVYLIWIDFFLNWVRYDAEQNK